MIRSRYIMLCGAALGASLAATPDRPADPLALLTTLSMMNSADRPTVESGQAVVTVLPATGRDLAVFGITKTEAGGARLAAWSRDVGQLYRGRYVPAIGRFSEPPQIEDLSALTLDEKDLGDLRKCRLGDCGVKVSGVEMQQIRQAATAAGAQWKPAVQQAFREVVLARATTYLRSGITRALPYQDHKKPTLPELEYGEIAARFGFEPLIGPDVMPYLQVYPDGGDGVESFLYWSKDALGGAKAIVSVTHVSIFHSRQVGGPGTVVAARQVFATHYLTGSLSFTAIIDGANGAPNYLIYLRRSRTDAFEGPFGKFVRRVVEGRVRSEAPAAFNALRRRLESGDPPGT